jgi:protein phosphatase PTC6
MQSEAATVLLALRIPLQFLSILSSRALRSPDENAAVRAILSRGIMWSHPPKSSIHLVQRAGSLGVVTTSPSPSSTSAPQIRSRRRQVATPNQSSRRAFHDYFISHLPSSSLHPDSGKRSQPHHKLPRSASTPHTSIGATTAKSPAALSHLHGSRDTTVVRIPLRSAKHHFGASVSRGERPYNEDKYQAGVVDIPAFAKRRPISLTHRRAGGAQTPIGAQINDVPAEDPQVFYFGVFDGHGGSECSEFLRDTLHEYVEKGAREFELESSLKQQRERGYIPSEEDEVRVNDTESLAEQERQAGQRALGSVEIKSGDEDPGHGRPEPPESSETVKQSSNKSKATELEKCLMDDWRELVGGYFRRFKPQYFSVASGGQGRTIDSENNSSTENREDIGIETVLTYSFLKADFDFVSAQVAKRDENPDLSERAINDDEILDRPHWRDPVHQIGGPKRFKGGSTASIALISTPTPAPFWNPAASSTIVVGHVGDTRVLLCETATGLAVPLTTNHHPGASEEATRLRRYSTSFITDSFGEKRVDGLANTRAFGDMRSKRIGVSAEPQVRRLDLQPAEYSFLVLVSDGVSAPLEDQEIVDIVKEARTPEQASRDVVSFATEVAKEPDNATALVVRLGGWERRGEGGVGSLGTKEMRDWKRNEAADPRSRRM